MIPRFSDAMSLMPVDGRPGDASRSFVGDLNEHWTIGPKIHGGVLVALCAKAAREGYGSGDSVVSNAQPVAVSVSFLSAPDPGPVQLFTVVRKRGRRIGLVDVELVQGQRMCAHGVVTIGEPEHQALPLFADSPLTGRMSVEPPVNVAALTSGDPGAEINHLVRGCDIHPVLESATKPVFTFWVRPKLGRVDELFALMCGDLSLPVTYAVGRRGWAPTVQLTAYLRGLPSDGWLRVACTTTQIGQDWFDADHTVADADGRVVVQTRQLALVPAVTR